MLLTFKGTDCSSALYPKKYMRIIRLYTVIFLCHGMFQKNVVFLKKEHLILDSAGLPERQEVKLEYLHNIT